MSVPPRKGAPPGLIPTDEEIRRGDTTDVYFRRTLEVLRASGRDRTRVAAEGFVKYFPDAYEYAILSGMDETLSLLSGREVDIDAILVYFTKPMNPATLGGRR